MQRNVGNFETLAETGFLAFLSFNRTRSTRMSFKLALTARLLEHFVKIVEENRRNMLRAAQKLRKSAITMKKATRAAQSHD